MTKSPMNSGESQERAVLAPGPGRADPALIRSAEAAAVRRNPVSRGRIERTARLFRRRTMNPHTARIGLGSGLALVSALAALLLAACSPARPVTPATLIVPARLNAATVDLAAVYDAVARYGAGLGLAPDAAQTDRAKGLFVSRRVRCSPNGDERHTAWCVFSFTVGPAPDDPTQVAVGVRVRVPERVEFDPKFALEQIRIEPALDRLVTELRGRFGRAEVRQTDMLQF
jgi:hypothetical protein